MKLFSDHLSKIAFVISSSEVQIMLVEKVLVAAAEAGLCSLGWKIDWDSHKNSSSSPRCFAFASCSPWVVEGAVKILGKVRYFVAVAVY